MAFQPKTYADLTASLRTGARVTINETTGVISSIQREDGSGRLFNVRFEGGHNGRDVEFIRTAD